MIHAIAPLFWLDNTLLNRLPVAVGSVAAQRVDFSRSKVPMITFLMTFKRGSTMHIDVRATGLLG